MKKIVPETLFEFKMLSNPRFAPDGKTAAFVVAQADEKANGYKSNIWLLKDGKTRQLTAGGDGRAFTWSPEGTILFPAARGPKDPDPKAVKTDFYEICPCGGEAQLAFSLPFKASQLTHLYDQVYAFDALVDLAPENKEHDKVYTTLDEIPFWFNGRGYINKLRNTLYLFDRATGETVKVSDDDWNVRFSDYKDGKLLYVGGPAGDGRTSRSGVYLYDIKEKTTKELIHWDGLRVGLALFSGDKILVTSSDGAKYGPSQSKSFYSLDPKDCSMTLIHEYEYSVGGGGVASDARHGSGKGYKMTEEGLYFASTVGHSCTMRLLTNDGEIKDIDLGVDCIDGFDMADGNILHCSYKGDHIAELFIGTEQVTHFNDALWDELDVRTPRFHKFTASDGYEIEGWCMTPSGYEPGTKYPVLFHIHGGPRSMFGSVFHHEMQQWANAGYFVIFCNPRGSDGRGDDFADIWGKYGTIDYDNLMEFVDEMLKVWPDMDKDNMCETGGSYGGYMTNWIIGHTDRFKACASQRSIANWIAFEHTSDIGPSFGPSQHHATTISDQEYLWDISPLKYAENVKTPTLFIHSDEDFRCWMVDGLSMFTALKMRNIDTKLCLFHGESHELSRSGRPAGRMARMHEITDWMDKYCK